MWARSTSRARTRAGSGARLIAAAPMLNGRRIFHNIEGVHSSAAGFSYSVKSSATLIEPALPLSLTHSKTENMAVASNSFPVLNSALDLRQSQYEDNRKSWAALLEKFDHALSQTSVEGSPEATAKHMARGQLLGMPPQNPFPTRQTMTSGLHRRLVLLRCEQPAIESALSWTKTRPSSSWEPSWAIT